MTDLALQATLVSLVIEGQRLLEFVRADHDTPRQRQLAESIAARALSVLEEIAPDLLVSPELA